MKLQANEMNAWFEAHLPQMRQALSDLVSCNSVQGQSAPGEPFGFGPKAALSIAINLCKKAGLATEIVADAVGEAWLPGVGEAGLGVLSHMDVVPAGPGWHTNPFELVEKDGEFFGRGVIDDKGPFVMSLFALLYLKEKGFKFKENVKLIFGTDEENGSEDMVLYEKHRSFPPKVFTPDGAFPLINIEKGRACPTFGLKFNTPATTGIVQMKGGEISNAVPGISEAWLKDVPSAMLEQAAAKDQSGCRFLWEETSEGLHLRVMGENAHASTPEVGVNALTGLLGLLAVLDLPEEQKKAVCGLAKLFPMGDWAGKALGVAAEDESGPLTAVLSQITWNAEGMTALCDIRFPLCQSVESLKNSISASCKQVGIGLISCNGVEPHVVSSDSPFVQTLLKVYEEETGVKGSKPLAIGGGTYVHHIEGGVAFGAEHPGCEYNMHGPDEHIPVKQFLTTAKIYARAIAALVCEDEA